MFEIIKSSDSSISLPNDKEISCSTFISRMAKMGFDYKFCSQVINCLYVGGRWKLNLTPGQAAFISKAPKTPKAPRGFA